MTSPVVIIVRTLTYCVCANITVRDNNICECAPFAKFAKIIDCKHFVTYGITYCTKILLWFEIWL